MIAEDPTVGTAANVVPICVVEVTGTDKCDDEMGNEVVIQPQIADPLVGSA